MALKPKEEIGVEIHKLDQFFRVEEGSGKAVLNGVRTAIRAGFAIIVPAGMNHNIINIGSVPLKLYTLYALPNHRDGVVTIPAMTRRPTMSTSMAKRRNRESVVHGDFKPFRTTFIFDGTGQNPEWLQRL
jgi:oxalate decarboxylase/phosphoglucose isomerase-like protein (cupin superfamily)